MERPRERNEEQPPPNPDQRHHRPGSGQLIWVTPTGVVRELDGGPTRPSDPGIEVCTACDGERIDVAVVREHRACGHVAMDGFLATAATAAPFQCPKCETTKQETFPAVATVACCLDCGHVLATPDVATDR